MSILDHRRKQRDLPADDGSATWLLRAARWFRGSAKSQTKRGQPPTDAFKDMIEKYEAVVRRLQPLINWSESEGYLQWRHDTLARLDEDLREWPEKYAQCVDGGYSAEQLAIAGAFFAGSQISLRRQFLVVENAVAEKQRHDRYQEKVKHGVEGDIGNG
jgi:hypothetical protein